MRFDKAILVKVLIFVAVSVAMTVVLGVRLANTRLFADRTAYEAEFENAAGVIKGDSVKVAGVDVGRVVETRIEEGKAIVTLDIDEEVDIPRDSRAAIRWRNVLGQRFVYVFPGDDEELLGEGDRIPITQTDKAGDIGALLNNAGPILRAIDPEKANLFLESVNTALSGNEVATQQLLDNASVLATDLANIDTEIGRVVDSSDEVLGAFASQDEAIHEILSRLDSLGVSLQRSTGDLNIVLTDFAVVQRHLARLVKDNATTIDATLADLESVADVLARNKKNLSRTLCTLPLGIAGYFQTTSWGEWFNVRITELALKDDQSRTIVYESEDPAQRSEKPPTPSYVACNDKKFSAAVGQTSAQDASVSEGPDGLLRFFLTGAPGGSNG